MTRSPWLSSSVRIDMATLVRAGEEPASGAGLASERPVSAKSTKAIRSEFFMGRCPPGQLPHETNGRCSPREDYAWGVDFSHLHPKSGNTGVRPSSRFWL